MATEAEILAETLKDLVAEKVAKTEKRLLRMLAKTPPQILVPLLESAEQAGDMTAEDFQKLGTEIQRYALEVEAEEIQELMSKLS